MKIGTFAATLAAALGVTSIAPLAPGFAATLLVDGQGRLTGATGVEVLGAFYDVGFEEGTCAAVFSGCNQPSDFAFTTFNGANAAAQALLSQVFIDGPVGQFDSQPNLTAACQDGNSTCFALIPFSPLNPNEGGGRQAQNRSGAIADTLAAFTFTPTTDTSTVVGVAWAKFTPSMSNPVPEPTTWATLIVGFGAVGAAIRRQRGQTRVTYAG